MYCETTVLLWIPLFIFLASAGCDNVASILYWKKVRDWSQVAENGCAYLWVSLDFEPVVAEVTFTPEWKDGRWIVVAYLLLFGVVPDSHADVIVAAITEKKGVWLSRRQSSSMTYHQILKGSSKRVMRIPWSILRALSPRACFPGKQEGQRCLGDVMLVRSSPLTLLRLPWEGS